MPLPSAATQAMASAEFERDIEEDHIRRAARQRPPQPLAVAEFLGVDAGPVQNEGEKMSDAAVAVDDKA